MKALCVGGKNDGRMVDVPVDIAHGEVVSVATKRNFPLPVDESNYEITTSYEKYAAKTILFGVVKRTVLLAPPEATTFETLQRLIEGYKRGEG